VDINDDRTYGMVTVSIGRTPEITKLALIALGVPPPNKKEFYI